MTHIASFEIGSEGEKFRSWFAYDSIYNGGKKRQAWLNRNVENATEEENFLWLFEDVPTLY